MLSVIDDPNNKDCFLRTNYAIKTTGNPENEALSQELLAQLRIKTEIRAVTVAFSNIEGKLHLLDYDIDFLMRNHQQLTFDGSSVRGFSAQKESDLRLAVDWGSLRVLPPNLLGGSSKVLVFANVLDKDGSLYPADFRGRLQSRLAQMNPLTMFAAFEIEGFLFKHKKAEQSYRGFFQPATEGGYFDSLPNDLLRLFIDKTANIQRDLAFENEKDHPEVAPSQFELNWKYAPALVAADQVQLYKLVCRVVADSLDCTASFLPKPIVGINGSGMHTNISIWDGPNNKFHENGVLSQYAGQFINGILARANDICLILNPSVNSYRRLDPAFEAPNEVKFSDNDRGSMIRIPLANKNSQRIEVRSVSPDANPYLVLLSLLVAGNEGHTAPPASLLPDNIYMAIEDFQASDFTQQFMGCDSHRKYTRWKIAQAERCPRLLGTKIKTNEIIFHHEVTNQALWKDF